MIDESRFLKKNGGPNLGPMDLNHAQNEIFRHFLEFGSYVFLEIAYNDSLRQCLTSSRGKTRVFGAQIWAKRAKLGPKISFFLPFSQVWFISFPSNCIDDSLEQCLKFYENIFAVRI